MNRLAGEMEVTPEGPTDVEDPFIADLIIDIE